MIGQRWRWWCSDDDDGDESGGCGLIKNSGGGDSVNLDMLVR